MDSYKPQDQAVCGTLKMLCILLNQDFNSFFKHKQAHPFSLVGKYDVFF